MVAGNLFRVFGDRNEIDDLVQEVFVIAFRGMERFRGEAKLSTWLYRICVNVALGKLRSRKRRPLPLPESAIPEQRSDGAPELADRALERRDDVARVYRALDQLSPKKRLVMVLHEIEGLELKEIATIVSVPVVTVRTRLHYARKDFYAIVAAADSADSADSAESAESADSAGADKGRA